MTIRVVVADDQALVRSGLRMLLDSAPDITVVAEAGDGRQAVALVGEHRPDVVLMDVRMPVMDGVEATSRIAGEAEQLPTRVLILTTFELDEYVYAALGAGASGFLLKDTDPHDLLAAVRVIAAGEALLSPRITRKLVAQFASRPVPVRMPPGALASLTEREREVLAMVAQGLSNAEIADRFVVSVGTVKTHVSRLLQKLHARDRVQLVVIAYTSGFVGSHR